MLPQHALVPVELTQFSSDTSEESKANSKQVLEGELADVKTGSDDTDKNPNRVAGGLKA